MTLRNPRCSPVVSLEEEKREALRVLVWTEEVATREVQRKEEDHRIQEARRLLHS
jgi:hypothetical protein